MTGKSPARLHMTIWREVPWFPPRDRKLLPPITVADLPHTEVSIARVLHEAGYLTALVGKWHLGDPAHYPETHGFDINIGGTLWGIPPTDLLPLSRTRGVGRDPLRATPGRGQDGRVPHRPPDRRGPEDHRPGGDRPFFLYLAHHAVHIPMEAKRTDGRRYRSNSMPAWSTRNGTYAA